MSDQDEFLVEIQGEFLDESLDLLNRVEGLSLKLAKNPEDDDVYAEIARLGHNFKGSGKAVGFDDLSKLGHCLEDYVLALRRKAIPIHPKSIDFLFKCLDTLKLNVETLKMDTSIKLDNEGILSEIENCIKDHEAFFGTNVGELQRHEAPAQKDKPADNHPAYAQKNNGNDSFRIPKQKLDLLLDSFGEQVILQSALEQYRTDFDKNKDEIGKTISLLAKQTVELQKQVLALTMVPIAPLFTKLERAGRDAARMCDKEIEFTFLGGEYEIDKVLVDSLTDSLIHMIRNSVDHGVESSDHRESIGKPRTGKIYLEARRVGAQMWIDLIDDGGGLNVERIKAKALSSGIKSEVELEKMNESEVLKLIFANGFSTKDQASEVSGRGVGMNVVQEMIHGLHGQILIDTQLGKGTCFRLKLPLSLAIFNGAIVRVLATRYIIPTTEISEITFMKKDQEIVSENGRKILRFRDEVFEFVDLREKLGGKKLGIPGDCYLILSRKNSRVCFAVDEVLGMQRVVQKSIGEELKSKPEFAAATILGDGTPGIVLNIPVLAARAA